MQKEKHKCTESLVNYLSPLLKKIILKTMNCAEGISMAKIKATSSIYGNFHVILIVLYFKFPQDFLIFHFNFISMRFCIRKHL